jgi:DNA polymerase III delta prime subunit
MLKNESILIYGGNKQNRLQKVLKIVSLTELKETPDLRIIDLPEKENSIKLDVIKDGIKFLQQKPFHAPIKYLIILSAEKITEEGQNALLKTLEEPPSHATIILSAKTERSLLETVVSRCRKIRTDESRVGDAAEKVTNVCDMKVGDRFVWAEETAKEEKEVIIELLEKLISEERARMLKAGMNEIRGAKAQNIDEITKVKRDLEKTNVNTRLALEFLCLRLK